MASSVLANVGGAGSAAMASVSSSCFFIAASSAGSKCSTRTRSKGGTPPAGPVQSSSNGLRVCAFMAWKCSWLGSPITLREAGQQVVDFRTRCGGERRAGPAQRVGGDHAAAHQHVLAHRESRPRLLLVADEGQVRVEEVVRRVALA